MGGDEIKPDINGHVLHLKPQDVWSQFHRLLQIPRRSGNEAGVTAMLRDFARSHDLEFQVDVKGNVLLKAPGKGRGINSPPITIQAHQDMVCVKADGVSHDFETDTIQTEVADVEIKGRIARCLCSKGTTLGADNGIGMALGLALIASDEVVDRPPVNLLCTVDEEIGLSGAIQLDPALLQTKMLLNLDIDDENVIYVSSAGSCDVIADLPIAREEIRADTVPYTLVLSGFEGGHSGTDIHEARGNPIISLAKLLGDGLSQEIVDGVGSLSGGTARNAIPGSATSKVWIKRENEAALPEQIRVALANALNSTQISDQRKSKIKIAVSPITDNSAPAPIAPASLSKLLGAISSTPNGVLAMSAIVADLVESSCNLGIVATSQDSAQLTVMARSSNDSYLPRLRAQLCEQLEAQGFKAVSTDPSPSWKAENSDLLTTATEVFTEHFGSKPRVLGVHAGLECGAFKAKRPDLSIISVGPNVQDLHAPTERVEIASVESTFTALIKLLERLC